MKMSKKQYVKINAMFTDDVNVKVLVEGVYNNVSCARRPTDTTIVPISTYLGANALL